MRGAENSLRREELKTLFDDLARNFWSVAVFVLTLEIFGHGFRPEMLVPVGVDWKNRCGKLAGFYFKFSSHYTIAKKMIF